MKKNITMRLSAVLLVAVLLTTCVISGTWAKYVTTGSATDSARVAKWGVTVKAETPDNKEFETSLTDQDNEILINAEVKTLAPGSGVKFASIDVSGQPEVSVIVNYSAVLTLEGWKLENGDEYVPLVFVVNGKEITGNTAAALKAAVEAEVQAYGKIYEAGTNLADQSAEELTISCYWVYSVDAETDAKDTYYGDLAALGSGPVVSLKITATVTQID